MRMKHDLFIQLVKQVMADRLDAMGEEPSSETLLAWGEGRLDASEREEFLERAAVDSAFARELLDRLDFPELPAGQPWDAPTRERKWQRFTERLVGLPDESDET